MREGDWISPRRELDHLFQEIRREAIGGVRKYFAVSGPRMTGKTTLVWSLRSRLAEEGIALVYVDLESQRGMDLDGFYRHLAREMTDQWPWPVYIGQWLATIEGAKFDQNAFMSFLRWLSGKSADRRRVVIALDNVGAVDRTEVASPFFATFRGLLNDHADRYGRFIFLFIGSLDLYELPNGALSPLLNVCVDIRQGNLDQESVARLVEPIAELAPDLGEKTFRIAGGHPYLTQRLCQVFVGQIRRGEKIDLEAAIEEIVGGAGGTVADPYIGHILRQLDRNDVLRKWVKNLLDQETPVPFSGPHDPSMYRPFLLGIAARGEDGNCRFANRLVERAVQRYFDATGASKIDRFPLKGQIYSGPRTVVHKAWHPDLEIPLAIKILPTEWFDSEDDIKRFQREARVMMEFRHPYICPVYDFGRQGREYYIVMKYVQGGNLQAHLAGETTEVGGSEAKRPAKSLRHLRMLLQVADAIHYAHGRGVIHRDLKPTNVMIDVSHEGAVPLVIDFGLAKNFLKPDSISISRQDILLGTPAYLSPELAEGDQTKVGVASDVYQLGGILYQMLTGSPPHSGPSLPVILARAAKSSPKRPSELDPEISPALEEVCLKALQRDPASRQADAASFRDELGQAIESMAESEVFG
ncbi:MAG: protein kinase [Planctomycetes bacterium]|nr:protein kinase [Planctomycetota bacterium]